MTVLRDNDRARPEHLAATEHNDERAPEVARCVDTIDAGAPASMDRRAAFAALASLAVVGLSACSSDDSAGWTSAQRRKAPGVGDGIKSNAARTRTLSSAPAAAVPAKPATQSEAVRFLNQATCGATQADIDRLMQIGYLPWLDEQFAMSAQHSHVQQVKRVAAQRLDGSWVNRPTVWDVNDSMWLGMIKSDQLRQRIMFALSQIFVVSLRDGSTYYLGSGLAAYVDMLYAKGFGNWRDLIEGVALSTAMGSYLSHIYNREDLANGVRPDQNFAREVMQLFTIGLWQLNADGSRKLDGNGKPIPTYNGADVAGAARVMTGWTFDAATDLHWERYYGFWEAADMPVQERPMKAFPAYHSRGEKKFLGVTIPASTVSNPVGELKTLLDTLFNHPNTAPFFCKQMIQRLVTSNPSAAYISRVVAVFNNNGSNVRGDLKAVIKAILLDPEARDNASVTLPTFGRVREQILRMTQVMRVFKATPDADPDSYGIGLWAYDRSKGLWQTPLGSPTVFNFYFPGYAPPNSTLSAQSLVAPEIQIVTQSSSADTWWFFKDLLQNGGLTDCCSDAQRNTYYLKLDYSQWLPLVANPASVADRLNTLFMAGQMSTELKNAIVAGMNARYQENSETSGMIRGRDQIKLAEAISFMLMSPEYVVQK
jgi:uncharacterized protein (DUF1800 family)